MWNLGLNEYDDDDSKVRGVKRQNLQGKSVGGFAGGRRDGWA
jgi:hypothetical protein